MKIQSVSGATDRYGSSKEPLVHEEKTTVTRSAANDQAVINDVDPERVRTSTLMMCNDDHVLLSKAEEMYSTAIDGANHIVDTIQEMYDYCYTQTHLHPSGSKVAFGPFKSLLSVLEDCVNHITYGHIHILDGYFGLKTLQTMSNATQFDIVFKENQEVMPSLALTIGGSEHCPHLLGACQYFDMIWSDCGHVSCVFRIAGEEFFTDFYDPEDMMSQHCLEWKHHHIPDLYISITCNERFHWLKISRDETNLARLQKIFSHIMIYQTRKIKWFDAIESISNIEIQLTHHHFQNLTFELVQPSAEQKTLALSIGGEYYRLQHSTLSMDASHYTAVQTVTFLDDKDPYQQFKINCAQRGATSFGPKADPEAIASVLQHLSQIYCRGGYDIAYGIGKVEQLSVVIPSFMVEDLFAGISIPDDMEYLARADFEIIAHVTECALYKAKKQRDQVMNDHKRCVEVLEKINQEIEALGEK